MACATVSRILAIECEAQRPLAGTACSPGRKRMPHRRCTALMHRQTHDGRARLQCLAVMEDLDNVWDTDEEEDYRAPPPPVLHNGVVDYYELLGIDDDASHKEIKSAYRSLAKECHPDYLGDEGHNICILLNEAYDVLSNSHSRSQYNEQLQTALIDEMDDYTGNALSKWLANKKMGRNWDPNEERAVFVDECSCIGCKQCVWLAPGVYRLESAYGRSRVFAQWANTEEDIQDSIDSCPVDCISWVHRDQLPSLEYVTQNRTKRNNVANIMSGMGSNADVFMAAAQFLKARERREKERARATQRSEQQERVRKQAAASLMKKRGGWMADFGSVMEAAFAGVAKTVDGSLDEEDTVAPKVGNRKRQAQPQPKFDPARSSIPLERSLVVRPKQ